MESQKLEQSSAPDDPAWESSKKFLDEHQHCHPHTEAVSDCFRCSWRYFRDVSIERIASLTAQVATLESEKAAAHEAIDEVVRGLEVIHTATPDGHDGFFHDLRAFLDERDIFNDDLYGERVISAAVKYLLDRVRSLSAPTKKQPK